ncbi:uncharacterized protein A4U43_C07F25870 [Asparagus officinalis]|uniref:Uncharacterized protein n=1 Tax=Asparagus officinalis TaxID=4686 RepID=A0A5P1EF04_ASPOF|nr:uncharacterized protein A4U43_C07F25870 [Asparagus officinalis]
MAKGEEVEALVEAKDGEESAEEASEGSAHDSLVNEPGTKKGEGVEAKVLSTPLPTSTIATPSSLIPAPGVGLPIFLSHARLSSPTS